MSTSPISENDQVEKPKFYYSARGGARSKEGEAAARLNVFSPPRAVIETPLPRDTTSHYLRGGTGNEWDYVIEDGVFERALAYDRIRLQELKWQDFNHRLSKTGLRGGAPIPKKKEPKTKKPKAKGLKIFRKRAISLTPLEILATSPSPKSPGDPVLPSLPATYFPNKSLEQRLYELSIASTDDSGSVCLSNFTAPTWLLVDDCSSSLRSSSVNSSLSPIETSRPRSPSLSTINTTLRTPNSSLIAFRGCNSLAPPGILVIKPDEAYPLNPEETGTSELSIDSPAIAL